MRAQFEPMITPGEGSAGQLTASGGFELEQATVAATTRKREPHPDQDIGAIVARQDASEAVNGTEAEQARPDRRERGVSRL